MLLLQDEVATGAAANGADGHSALADRLDAVLHVPPQYQVPLCLAAHTPAQIMTAVALTRTDASAVMSQRSSISQFCFRSP